MKCAIRVSEHALRTGTTEQQTDHPLDILDRRSVNGDCVTAGKLSFAQTGLSGSAIFDDVRAIWVEFSGEEEPDREAWADDLRGELLQRISVALGSNWWLNIKGDLPDPHDPELFESLDVYIKDRYTRPNNLKAAQISMPLPGKRHEVESRLIVEYPARLVKQVVHDCWPKAYAGAPIEGYLLPPDGLEKIKKWNTKPRSAELFREVLDSTELLFTTAPEEHRHFVFFTAKHNLASFKKLAQLEELKQRAGDIQL